MFNLNLLKMFLTLTFTFLSIQVFAGPVVVTGDGYPPYADTKLPKGGFATAVVHEVLSRMGKSTEIDWRPWKRGYEETLKHQYMATFPYVNNKERRKVFDYSQPIAVTKTVLFYRSDSKFNFEEYEKLTNVTTCKGVGYSTKDLDEYIDKKSIILIRAPDLENCMKMLIAGRVDSVSIVDHVGRQVLEKLKKGGKYSTDTVKSTKRVVIEEALHLIVAKDNPKGKEFLAQFNSYLEQVKKDGTYNRLYPTYFPK